MHDEVARAAGGAAGRPSAVQVALRVRPMNAAEEEQGAVPCITVDPDGRHVQLFLPENSFRDPRVFQFDHVYSANATQAL
ncbi:hypothetical protein T484DRAFT_1845483 [Baffinella frigidus]|nr:hypothetical protein T484DRAFT_1845483 [Cryptophyta sp. CCMP2293]